MIDYAESLFEKHGTTGLVLDTNLLLLLIVGGASRELVGKGRLNMFSSEDYDTILAIVRRFSLITTTPNILTEVSNLADALAGRHREAYIASFVDNMALLNEQYLPSHGLVGSAIFNLFGLGDAAIAEIASRELLVMTMDLPLYQYLSAMDLDVLNFNHIRTSYWT